MTHAPLPNHSPQLILVCIAQLLKHRGRRLRRRWLAVHHVVHAQLVLYDVRDGLCIGGGAGSATPDGIVDTGQLVCHSVGNVCAGRRSGISA